MERGGGWGELDQSHLGRKFDLGRKKREKILKILSYWTPLPSQDISCGHHPTLHLMVKKVLSC